MMQDIEALCRDELREGVSPGAAARQMCRSLPAGSKVKEMLEAMLAAANRASFDRSVILQQFKEAAPAAGHASAMESYRRSNGMAPETIAA